MATLVRNDFTGGILSPSLRMRSDISKYPNGMAACENFLVNITGGASFRPGTQFCAGMDYNTAAACRLIPFVYNESLAYVLLLRDSAMDVYHLGEKVKTGVTSPYTAAEIWDVDFAQSGSQMTLVHPKHNAFLLELLDVSTQAWSLAEASLAPAMDPPTGLLLTAEGDVAGGGDYDKTYAYRVSAVSAEGRETFASTSASITQKSLSLTYGVRLSWSAPTGNVEFYRVYKQANFESEVFGWIGDSNTTNFVDFNIGPVTSDGPLSETVALPKPSSVTFYQQRQVFGAPEDHPQSIVASQTGYPWGFQQGRPVRADDAFNMAVFTPQFNKIQYLVPLETLLILTSGSELRTTEGVEQVFGPLTSGIRQMSTNGCSRVKPIIAVDSLLYVQEKGQRLRELAYSDDGGVNQLGGKDLSVLTRNLFQGRKIKQIAYRNAPESLLWCVMDDGALLGVSYHRAEKITAWHTHTLGHPAGGSSKVMSSAVVPEGPEDMAYFVVLRDGPGGYKQASVERMPSVDTTATAPTASAVSVCHGMDGWLRYEGAAVDTVSGLDHLKGQEVTVVADGFVVPGMTVSSAGAVTLPYKAKEIRVGLGYSGYIDMLPIYGQNVELGGPKSISAIYAYVRASRGMWAGSIVNRFYDPGPKMYEIRPRQVSDGYGPPGQYTGGLDLALLGPWGPDVSLRMEQRDPFPLNILAVEYHVDL